MFLYGASGHSKVIIDIIRASGKKMLEGLYDDNPMISEISGISVNNDSSILEKDTEWIISIGNNAVRKKIADKVKRTFVSAIHPDAIISPSSNIEEGTVVMARVVINADSNIGKHCIINSGAIIEHDCVLNDYVHISPNVALAGNVFVGEGSHIGIGACVIQGTRIGKWVTIGAGSVVINDIPDYAVVVGVPGRVIKYNQ